MDHISNKSYRRDALRKARRCVGLTQSKLARKLGLTPSAVNAWEAGRRTPSPEQIPDLAEVLGMQPGELLGIIDVARAA